MASSHISHHLSPGMCSMCFFSGLPLSENSFGLKFWSYVLDHKAKTHNISNEEINAHTQETHAFDVYACILLFYCRMFYQKIILQSALHLTQCVLFVCNSIQHFTNVVCYVHKPPRTVHYHQVLCQWLLQMICKWTNSACFRGAPTVSSLFLQGSKAKRLLKIVRIAFFISIYLFVYVFVSQVMPILLDKHRK